MSDVKSKSEKPLPGPQPDGSWILDKDLGSTYGEPEKRSMGLATALVQRFNPYHDEAGRFTTGDGASGGVVGGGGKGGGRREVGEPHGAVEKDDISVYGAKLKNPLGEDPLGTIAVNDDGTLRMEPSSAKAAAALARLEKEGVRFGEVAQRYEQLFDESSPEDGNWYYDRFEQMNAYATEHDIPQSTVTAVTAALSARVAWDHDTVDPQTGEIIGQTTPNWPMATTVMDIIQKDEPFELGGKMVRPSQVKDARALALGHSGLGIGLPDNVTKAIELMRGGEPDKVLGGNKIRSFYNDMMRPSSSNAVTIDTLMLHAALGTHEVSSNKQGRTLGASPYNYNLYSQAVKYIASKHGIAPHEAQARIWYAWRNRSGVQARQAAAREKARTYMKAREGKGKKR